MFWNLTDTDDETRWAHAPDDQEIEFKKVSCPLDSDHLALKGRITPLRVVLPNLRPQDFVWTWGNECLVQERVLELFHDSGFTGYEALPVQRVEFVRSKRKPPRLWEIVVKGSGGMASPECGIRVIRVCPGCALTDYSRITDPTKLIELSQWDGSDFFRVAPVEGFIFVTDRVIQALRKNAITGWNARSLADMQGSFDNVLLVDSTTVN